MDTQTLKTFLTLASLNNFTQTADQLFVAQSTVTNRIAELEREVGKKLFLRDKKSVRLTKEGQLFLTYAKRMVDLEEQAMKDLNSFCYQNTLRIGSTNTIYECHLYPLIHQFILTHTDTSVKVVLGHSNELIHMLQDGIIDVVFSYLPFHRTGFQCTQCFTDELVLVTTSTDDSMRSGIMKEQLCDLKYLMCNFALQEVGLFIRSLFPDHYQFPFEIDNSTKLIQYLKDGLGYSFLPLSLVKEELDNGSLIQIPVRDLKPPKIASYCTCREEFDLSKLLHLKRRNSIV